MKAKIDYNPIYLKNDEPIQPLTEKEKSGRLTEQVRYWLTKRYPKGFVLDAFETIIKRFVEVEGRFVCSRANIARKILAIHDTESNIVTLLIGPYNRFRGTVLETFCQRISSLMYETGLKEEIVQTMFSFILMDMKERFSNRKGDYTFKGIEGTRDEGTIRSR